MKITFLLVTFLFLISSCYTPFQEVPRTPIIPPPVFSFLNIDPNNTNNNYIERMNKYDTIIQKCPIPLYIIKIEELPSALIDPIQKEYKNANFLGIFFYNRTYKGYPSDFIFINSEFPPETILSAFFHEYTHYIHREKKCSCFISDEYGALSEEHSLIGELKLGLEHNTPLSLYSSIISIYMYILKDEAPLIYKIAALKTLKTKEFIKARSYINKEK